MGARRGQRRGDALADQSTGVRTTAIDGALADREVGHQIGGIDPRRPRRREPLDDDPRQTPVPGDVVRQREHHHDELC